MVNLLMTDSGRIYAFGSNFYQDIAVPTVPIVTRGAAELIARSAVPFDTTSSRYTRPAETVVLPVLDRSLTPPQMRFHLAHRIDVPTREPLGHYASYVDASTGQVLRRENLVQRGYYGFVKGDIEDFHPCDGPATQLPLAGLSLDIAGNAVVTGADGGFSLSGGPQGSAPFIARLSGPRAEVHCTPRTNNLGQHTSIAVDSASGDVHISSLNETRKDLLYAWKRAGRWSIESAEMLGEQLGADVGRYTSIATSNGIVSIAHFQGDGPTAGRLRFAQRAGGTWIWSRETVNDATSSFYGIDASLETTPSDPDGPVWVSYEDAFNHKLKFAYKIGGAWTVELVDAGVIEACIT